MNLGKFKDWEVGEGYVCEKLLGTGSYGSVCQATHTPTGRKVAIKRMEGVFEDETDCKRILREIKLLRKLRHPFVVELFDIIEPKDPENFDVLYIVMEYAESDLKKVVKSAIHLQKVHIQTIVYNLLCAVKYIHSGDVLHRDLKPANVLVNEDCSIKVCDFGLARSIAGLQSSQWILEGRKAKKEGEEYKLGEGEEECNVIKGAGLAKLHHNDESSTAMQEDQTAVAEAAKEGEPEEKKKKELRHKLERTKDQRKNMKRELTGHVVTRWYRAPELILLEKDYGPAIDVWSIGCIFAELLGMMKENAPTYLDRKPLFPGKSCFPLSPDKHTTEKRKGFPFSNSDQLNVIFDVLGSPNEDDTSFVTDQKALEYLASFQERKRKDLSALYPAAGEDALKLLDRFLVFNPFYRISIDECIEHPFLEKVRKKEKEKLAPEKIQFDFEKEHLNKKKLRELFLEEISYYKELHKKSS